MEIEYVDNIMIPGIGPKTVALLASDTHAGPWVKQSGRLNYDVSGLGAAESLRGSDGVIWDLGAMIGDYTCGYANMAKHVLAIEARGDAFACLDHNMQWYTNVECLKCIAGDGTRADEEVYPLANVNAGSRRMRVAGDVPGASRSLTLDEILATRNPPTLLKMDIEGWEAKALKGATKILSEVRPVMILEVNLEMLARAGNRADEIAQILKVNNYQACDLLTREPWKHDDNLQRDIACWPVEKGSPWK